MRNVNPIKVGDTQLYHGDARQVLFHLDSNSLDSCVTDSPYHLSAGNGSRGFMGMDWDGGCIAFDASFWSELLRVLKPGAFLLTLGHPRTSHRMATAIEKSGFEIRDTITWIRGQGMPYGKQLKGLNEPGVLARKPLEGSLSSNMAKWGVGELFVERCRVNGRFPSNTIISPEVADILKRKAKFFFCPRVSLRERNAG